MHLHTDDVDVAQFCRTFVNCGQLVECNPELILAQTGGDVFVRLRSHIGVDAQRDRRAQVFGTRDAIYAFQLGLALDVEAVNGLVERVFDFLTRFAHAGKRAFCRIATRSDYTKKFAAGNNVEPRSSIREQLQDSANRVSFDGITNQVIEWRKRLVQTQVMIENSARAVNISGRAKFLRHGLKIYVFAAETSVAVMKKMHVVAAFVPNGEAKISGAWHQRLNFKVHYTSRQKPILRATINAIAAAKRARTMCLPSINSSPRTACVARSKNASPTWAIRSPGRQVERYARQQ